MANNILVVLTNPVAGKEKEFNEWYTNTHVREIVQIPGFVSAQRYKLGDAQMGPTGSHQYLAIYEIDGDPQKALDALKAARPDLTQTDALDRSSTLGQVFSAISEKVSSGVKV
jgi:hypothetical protein